MALNLSTNGFIEPTIGSSPAIFSPTNNTITQSHEREIDSVIQRAIDARELNLSNKNLNGDVSLFYSDAIQSAYLRGYSPIFQTIDLSQCKFDLKGFKALLDTIVRCSLVDHDDDHLTLKKFVCRQNNLSLKEYGLDIANLIKECNGSIRELDLCDSQLGVSGIHSLVSATFTSNVLEKNMPMVYSIYQLLVLDISGNNIGDMGVLSICKGMASLVRRHQPINLQILRLNRNNITDHGAQCITQQLMLMISSTVSHATTTVYDHFGLTPSPQQKQYNSTLHELSSPGAISKISIGNISPLKPQNNYNIVSYMKLQELDLDDNNIGITGIHSILSILPTYTSLQVLSLARCQPNFTILEILSSVLSSGATMVDFIDLKFTDRVAEDAIQETRRMQQLNRTTKTNGKLLDHPWTSVMRRLVDGIRKRAAMGDMDSGIRLRVHLGALPNVLFQHVRTPVSDAELDSNQELFEEKVDMIGALDVMYSVNEVFRLSTDIQRWIVNNHAVPNATEVALAASMSNDDSNDWSLAQQLPSHNQPVSPEVSPQKSIINSARELLNQIKDVPDSVPTVSLVIPPSPTIFSSSKEPSNQVSNSTKPGDTSMSTFSILLGLKPSPANQFNGLSDNRSDQTNNIADRPSTREERALKAVENVANKTKATLKASPSPLHSPTTNNSILSPKMQVKSRLAFNFDDYDLPMPPTEPVLKSSAAMAATLLSSRDNSPSKGSNQDKQWNNALEEKSSSPHDGILNSNASYKDVINNKEELSDDFIERKTSPVTPPKIATGVEHNDIGLALGGIDTLLLSPSSRLAMHTLKRGTNQSSLNDKQYDGDPTNIASSDALSTINDVNARIKANNMKANDIISRGNDAHGPDNSSKPVVQTYQPQDNDTRDTAAQKVMLPEMMMSERSYLGSNSLEAVLGHPPQPTTSRLAPIDTTVSRFPIPAGPLTLDLIDKQVKELERMRQEKLGAMRKLAEVAEDLVKSTDSLQSHSLESFPYSLRIPSDDISRPKPVNTTLQDIIDDKSFPFQAPLNVNTRDAFGENSHAKNVNGPLTFGSNGSLNSLGLSMNEEGLSELVRKVLSDEIERSIMPLLSEKNGKDNTNKNQTEKSNAINPITTSIDQSIRSPLASLVHKLDPANKSSSAAKAPWTSENAFASDQPSHENTDHTIVSPSGKKRIKVSTPKRAIRIDVTLPPSPAVSSMTSTSAPNDRNPMTYDQPPFSLSRVPPISSKNTSVEALKSPQRQYGQEESLDALDQRHNPSHEIDRNDPKTQELWSQFEYLKSRMKALENNIRIEQNSPRRIKPSTGQSMDQSSFIEASSAYRLASMTHERERLKGEMGHVENQLHQALLDEVNNITEAKDTSYQPQYIYPSNADMSYDRQSDDFINEIVSTGEIPPLANIESYTENPQSFDPNPSYGSLRPSVANAMTSPIPTKNSQVKAALGSPLYDALTSLVNQSSTNRSIYPNTSIDPSTMNGYDKSMVMSSHSKSNISEENDRPFDSINITSIAPNMTSSNPLISMGNSSILTRPSAASDPIHDLHDRMKNLEIALEAEHESTIKVLEILLHQNLKKKEKPAIQDADSLKDEKVLGQKRKGSVLGPMMSIGEGINGVRDKGTLPVTSLDFKKEGDISDHYGYNKKRQMIHHDNQKPASPLSDDSYFDDVAATTNPVITASPLVLKGNRNNAKVVGTSPAKVAAHAIPLPSEMKSMRNSGELNKSQLPPRKSTTESNARRDGSSKNSNGGASIPEGPKDSIRLKTSATNDNSIMNSYHPDISNSQAIGPTSNRSVGSRASSSADRSSNKVSAYTKQLPLPHVLPPPPLINSNKRKL